MACNAFWLIQCSKHVYMCDELSSTAVHWKVRHHLFDDILIFSSSL